MSGEPREISRGEHSGPHDGADVVTLDACALAGGKLVVPLANFLLTAKFARSGTTLERRGADGTLVRVEDNFRHDEVADLWTPGGAVFPGELVERLAGPVAEGWAQAAGGSGRPISVVEQVIGNVQAERADGSTVNLSEGSAGFQGNVVTTGAGARLGIRFADETAFAMEGNGRMVLDELVYDPSSQAGSASVSILQGAFVFVTGQIAKTDPDSFEVKTPLATIGVRGTLFGGIQGEQMDVFFDDGRGFVFNLAGRENIEAGQNLTVLSADQAPGAPQATPAGQFDQIFGLSLGVIPTTPFTPLERRGDGGQPGGQQGGRQQGEQQGHAASGDGATTTALIEEAVGTEFREELQEDTVVELEQSGEPELLLLEAAAVPPTGITDIGTLAPGFGDPVAVVTDPLLAAMTVQDPNSGLVTGPDLTPRNIVGSNLPDNIVGGAGPDTLDGGAGNDILDGGPGDDVVLGGTGNDTLIGGTGEGNDNLDGGDDIDTDIYSSAVQPLVIDLGAGTAVGDPVAIGNDVLANIENVGGGQAADMITGSATANDLQGGNGNDTLLGGGGNDRIEGGAGIDTAVFSGNFADYSFLAGNLVSGPDGTDTVVEVEFLQFDDGPVNAADHIVETAANVTGTASAGMLAGAIGPDVIAGLDGNDTLTGGSSDDELLGAGGGDLLDGGSGADTLDGGAGTDTADYQNDPAAVNVDLGNDQLNGGDGVDRAVFSGNLADYTITTIDATTTIVSHDNLGVDGTDTLNGVEVFEFADQIVEPLLLSVSDVVANEGDGTAVFTVGLNQVGQSDVTFNLATAPGTATAGANYTTQVGNAKIAAGDLSTTVAIALNDDTAFEADETFFLNLGAVTSNNGFVFDGQGLATILDNNVLPSRLSVNNANALEGNALTFTLQLDNPTVALPFTPTVGGGDPTATFLRTNSDAGSADATAIDLASLGIAPGEEITLRTLGDVDLGASTQSMTLLGVFSSSRTLLATAEQARVQDAVDAGTDIANSPTFNGDLATDISEEGLSPWLRCVHMLTYPLNGYGAQNGKYRR